GQRKPPPARGGRAPQPLAPVPGGVGAALVPRPARGRGPHCARSGDGAAQGRRSLPSQMRTSARGVPDHVWAASFPTGRMALLRGQAALPAVLDVQQQAEADLRTVANERDRPRIAPCIEARAATWRGLRTARPRGAAPPPTSK